MNEFTFFMHNTRTLYSRVSITTGHGLDGREVGVQVPVGASFSSLHVVQTGSTAHPASYSILGTLSPGAKRPEGEAHRWRTRAEVKNTWMCLSTPTYIFTVYSLGNAFCCVFIVLNYWAIFPSNTTMYQSTHSHLLCITEFIGCTDSLHVSAHLEPSSGDMSTFLYYWTLRPIWIHILLTPLCAQIVFTTLKCKM
jgi:hypothetical protein